MTRILNMSPKFMEIGRLRAGFNDPTKTSKDKRAALSEWRFTSRNEEAIYKVAEVYGGEPRPWAERPGELELFSTSSSLKVELPGDAFFSAYEKWSKGGCQRRCDGERCTIPVEDPDGGHLDEVDCWCEEKGLEPGDHKDACDVKVRLKVMLSDIPGLGVWMLTSSSVYAAVEMSGIYDIIEATRMRTGILVPCTLSLDHREEKRAYERFKRDFYVPVLQSAESLDDLKRRISGANVIESIAPVRPALEPALRPATGAPAPAPGLPAPAEGPPEGQEGEWGACHPSYVMNACNEHEIDMSGTNDDRIARLIEAGVMP